MTYRTAILMATMVVLPACGDSLPTAPAASMDVLDGVELDDPFAALLGTADMLVDDASRALAPVQSARGHGDVVFLTKQTYAYGFSFTARREGEITKLEDAKGEFEYFLVDPTTKQEFRIHGDVTCLRVVATEAIVGGVIKRSDSRVKGLQPGDGVVFHAVDQGEEGESNPFDLLSQLVPTGDPRFSCLKVKVVPPLPIQSGNIQIPWLSGK